MRAKQPGELTSVKEIATLYGVPFEATSKVMQVLASGGVIRSEQGAHGGYQVVRDLNRVSLFEIMEIVVGRVEIAKCLHEVENTCDLKTTCNVISPISSLNRRLIDFYKSLMVGELLESRTSVARTAEAHA